MRKRLIAALFLLMLTAALCGFEYSMPTETPVPTQPAGMGFAFSEAAEASPSPDPQAEAAAETPASSGSGFAFSTPQEEAPPLEPMPPEADPTPTPTLSPAETPLLPFEDQVRSTPSSARSEALLSRGAFHNPRDDEDEITFLDPDLMAMMSEEAVAYWSQVAVRVVGPAPSLLNITQSAQTLTGSEMLVVSFQASTDGSLEVYLLSNADGSILAKSSLSVQAGVGAFRWDGAARGARVAPGSYALVMTLRAASGEASGPSDVVVAVDVPAEETSSYVPAFVASASAPYSDIDDGTFWSMSPGEVDDAVVWDILMQLITVYDGGLHPTDHVYLKSNPDGTGDDVAQVHGQSQGLHVIGEVNEYGYILVETFSNYNLTYQPKTPEEMATAYELKQGYVLAENLLTLNPQPDIGFVVDKLTQRMYMYQNGKKVTEFIVSTGKGTDEAMYRETIPGEFITISHVGGYWSNEVYSDFSIRFNGGTLMHQIPFMILDNGAKHYGYTERALGTKASAGCVRVHYKPNEEGYNMEWIFDNLKREGRYKIIIWDDLNRRDVPTTWR